MKMFLEMNEEEKDQILCDEISPYTTDNQRNYSLKKRKKLKLKD
jgi:hypothetical protein